MKRHNFLYMIMLITLFNKIFAYLYLLNYPETIFEFLIFFRVSNWKTIDSKSLTIIEFALKNM